MHPAQNRNITTPNVPFKSQVHSLLDGGKVWVRHCPRTAVAGEWAVCEVPADWQTKWDRRGVEVGYTRFETQAEAEEAMLTILENDLCDMDI